MTISNLHSLVKLHYLLDNQQQRSTEPMINRTQRDSAQLRRANKGAGSSTPTAVENSTVISFDWFDALPKPSATT